MNAPIKNVIAEEVLDSRGNPTIKVTVTAGAEQGSFSVPSGASTGSLEAIELRDGPGGAAHVKKAIANLAGEIKDLIVGKDVFDQQGIDMAMIKADDTNQKSRLGGNAMIGVSIAVAQAAARVQKKESFQYLRTLRNIKPSRKVPHLYSNLVNGGKHAKSQLAFQEYMVVPTSEKASDALRILVEIEKNLGEIIQQEFGNVQRGDEGGYALDVKDVRVPLSLLVRASERAGHTNAVRYALDVAASSFYDAETSTYHVGDEHLDREGLYARYVDMCKEFPILSIEDPFEEQDFEGFAMLQKSAQNLVVVGDDLTVTNKRQLEKAIKQKAIRALIIKPNQIGTLTEVLDTMELARNNNIECIISHRSGETMDPFIADLAYAFGAFGLKAGAPVPKERLAKYNRLITISE